MGWLTTVLAVFLGVSGNSVNTITNIYWLNTDISSYGVSIVSNTYFLFAFWALLLGHAVYYRDWGILQVATAPEERRLFARPVKHKDGWHLTQAQLVVIIGFLFTWMSIQFTYGSPPSRTPPLIQSVLLNMSVLVAIPVSKWLLRDNKKYFSWAPMTAGCLIMAGVVVSLLPTLMSDLSGQFTGGAKTLIWCLFYAMGNIPWALESVVEQAYLIRAGLLEDDVTWKDTQIGCVRMLAWAGVWQLVFTFTFFWTDFLPFFGLSSTPAQFWTHTTSAIACSFGGPSWVTKVGGDPSTCGPNAPWFALASSVGYVIAYMSDAVLNRDSATFSILNYVLISCSVAVFFLIPGLNPNPTNTPVWSVVTSVVLSVAGEILWKWWEDASDPADQFDVATADPVHHECKLPTDISLHPLLPGAKASGDKGATYALDPEHSAFTLASTAVPSSAALSTVSGFSGRDEAGAEPGASLLPAPYQPPTLPERSAAARQGRRGGAQLQDIDEGEEEAAAVAAEVRAGATGGVDDIIAEWSRASFASASSYRHLPRRSGAGAIN